jgi:hypothetical protein
MSFSTKKISWYAAEKPFRYFWTAMKLMPLQSGIFQAWKDKMGLS